MCNRKVTQSCVRWGTRSAWAWCAREATGAGSRASIPRAGRRPRRGAGTSDRARLACAAVMSLAGCLLAIGCGGPAPVDAGMEPDAGRDAGSDAGSDAGAPRPRAFSLSWARVIESDQTLGVLADSRIAAQPDD